MPTFHQPEHIGSPEAALLLHPAAGRLAPPPTSSGSPGGAATGLPVKVLADIAGGLAAAVDPATWRQPAAVLLTTPSYVASVERIGAGQSVTVAAQGRAVALSVASGDVLVWTARGCDLVGPGRTLTLAGRERAELTAFGDGPAVLVSVRALGPTRQATPPTRSTAPVAT